MAKNQNDATAISQAIAHTIDQHAFRLPIEDVTKALLREFNPGTGYTGDIVGLSARQQREMFFGWMCTRLTDSCMAPETAFGAAYLIADTIADDWRVLDEGIEELCRAEHKVPGLARFRDIGRALQGAR